MHHFEPPFRLQGTVKSSNELNIMQFFFSSFSLCLLVNGSRIENRHRVDVMVLARTNECIINEWLKCVRRRFLYLFAHILYVRKSSVYRVNHIISVQSIMRLSCTQRPFFTSILWRPHFTVSPSLNRWINLKNGSPCKQNSKQLSQIRLRDIWTLFDLNVYS